MKKKLNSSGIVYSTDPGFKEEVEENQVDLPASEQMVLVKLDRKQRAGKTVTLVEGFEMSDEKIEQLAKQLKNICGTGGSAKNGEIIIQGDHKEKIFNWLQKQGFTKVKKA